MSLAVFKVLPLVKLKPTIGYNWLPLVAISLKPTIGYNWLPLVAISLKPTIGYNWLPLVAICSIYLQQNHERILVINDSEFAGGNHSETYGFKMLILASLCF